MFCCLKMTDAYFIIIISRLFHLAVGQPFFVLSCVMEVPVCTFVRRLRISSDKFHVL